MEGDGKRGVGRHEVSSSDWNADIVHLEGHALVGSVLDGVPEESENEGSQVSEPSQRKEASGQDREMGQASAIAFRSSLGRAEGARMRRT